MCCSVLLCVAVSQTSARYWICSVKSPWSWLLTVHPWDLGITHVSHVSHVNRSCLPCESCLFTWETRPIHMGGMTYSHGRHDLFTNHHGVDFWEFIPGALWSVSMISVLVFGYQCCVAVCCAVLQSVAVCCAVLQCVAVCCSVLQCVAASRTSARYWMCCLKSQWSWLLSIHLVLCCSVLRCVAVCCSVLRCVAVCCSVLQCVAVSQTSACYWICCVKSPWSWLLRIHPRCTLICVNDPRTSIWKLVLEPANFEYESLSTVNIFPFYSFQSFDSFYTTKGATLNHYGADFSETLLVFYPQCPTWKL